MRNGIGMLVIALMAQAGPATPAGLFSVKVVDEHGRALPTASGNVQQYQTEIGTYLATQPGWSQADATGVIRWTDADLHLFGMQNYSPERECLVLLRAPGYAYVTTTITIGQTNAAPTVTLTEGRKLRVTLAADANRPLPPDLVPIITNADHFYSTLLSLGYAQAHTSVSLTQASVLDRRGHPTRPSFSQTEINERIAGLATGERVESMPGNRATFEYRLPVAPPTGPAAAPQNYYVFVHHPGYLRMFYAGPYDRAALESADFTVELPTPRTVSISPQPAPGRTWDALQTTGTLMVQRPIRLLDNWKTKGVFETHTIAPGDWPRLHWQADDLAPALYSVYIWPNAAAPGVSSLTRSMDARTTDALLTVVMDTDEDASHGESARLESAALDAMPPVLPNSLGYDHDKTALQVEVTDADGTPVPGAQAIVLRENGDRLNFEWRTANNDGLITLRRMDVHRMYMQGEMMTGRHMVFVRAPGYAAATAIVDLPTSQTRVPLMLSKGRTVEFTLRRADGTPAPTTATIAVVPSILKDATIVSFTHQDDSTHFVTLAEATPLEPGRFRMQLPEQFSQVEMLVNTPGFALGFTSQPITPAMLDKENGQLDIVVPETASLTTKLTPPPGTDDRELAYSKAGFSVSRIETDATGTRRAYTVADEQFTSTGATLHLDGLTPGEYRVEAYTGVPTNRWNKSRAGYYEENKTVTIVAGETTHTQFTYKPAKVLTEDYRTSLSLHVTRFDGTPAGGLRYRVYGSGGRMEREVAFGRIPDDGRIMVESVPMSNDFIGLSLSVENEHVKSFRVPANAKTSGIVETAQLSMTRGDTAPDVRLIDLTTSETVALSDLRGKMVLMDFWASWCGPCRQPVKDLNLLIEQHPEWDDRLVVLGVSLDDTAEDARKHAEQHRLTAWRLVMDADAISADDAEASFGSAVATAFRVTKIPTWILIDKNGKVITTERLHKDGLDAALIEALEK